MAARFQVERMDAQSGCAAPCTHLLLLLAFWSVTSARRSYTVRLYIHVYMAKAWNYTTNVCVFLTEIIIHYPPSLPSTPPARPLSQLYYNVFNGLNVHFFFQLELETFLSVQNTSYTIL